MSLRAQVTKITGATMHFRAHLAGSEIVKDEQLAVPAWVQIEAGDGGYLLLYFDASGKCLTDTWHLTVEEAKAQAQFEFGIEEAAWHNKS
jgi:hypothetical protein